MNKRIVISILLLTFILSSCRKKVPDFTGFVPLGAVKSTEEAWNGTEWETSFSLPGDNVFEALNLLKEKGFRIESRKGYHYGNNESGMRFDIDANHSPALIKFFYFPDD